MEAFSGSFPDYLWEKFSCVYIYLWSVRELRTTAANMLGLTKNTVGNVYALLRPRDCGIIVGGTYRKDLSFHLEAMCTLQNATRANLSVNPRYVN